MLATPVKINAAKHVRIQMLCTMRELGILAAPILPYLRRRWDGQIYIHITVVAWQEPGCCESYKLSYLNQLSLNQHIEFCQINLMTMETENEPRSSSDFNG